MQLRKLLIAGAAMTVAAMAPAPAAQADTPTGGPIESVAVGGDTTTASYDVTLVAKTPFSVTMKIFGSDTKLGCTSGSASGEVHAGSPAPNPVMSFDSVTMTCDSLIPGQTTIVSVPSNGCANVTLDDDNVHTGDASTGTVDTGPKNGKVSVVDGSFNLTGSCVVTVSQGVCTYTIGGVTEAQFDEAVEPNGAQQLILKGTGLEILSAGALCFGAMSVGDTISLDTVTFDVLVDDGPVDARDTP